MKFTGLNFKKKLGSRVIILTLFLIFSYSFFLKNVAASESYLIKLKTYAPPEVLLGASDTFEEIFSFSENLKFQNIYKISSNLSAKEISRKLAGQLEFLEVNKEIKNQDVAVNDPGFTSDSSDIDKQWALSKAGFDKAWVNTVGSKNNLVAIIDSGIDQTHEDLHAINFVEGYDFVTKKPILPGSNSDDNGHGTLIAGILGATSNNNKGITGNNWYISIIPIKALDKTGKGDSASIAQGIVWAADHGAKIINLSVGGVGFSHDTALSDAIAYAFKKNIVIVAAAGNDTLSLGKNLDIEPVYPICDDNDANMVIGVTALDQNDQKPNFANYGKNCIDVSAPGKRILSTINLDPATKKSAPDSYAYASGSSLAVPYVAGQAALILALHPGISNVQVRSLIISTADQIDQLNLNNCQGSCFGYLGSGRINVKKSLDKSVNTQAFAEEDLIYIVPTGMRLQILGGQKRIISNYVYEQRFNRRTFINIDNINQLVDFPFGPYILPNDETLIKLENSPAVYIIRNGEKMPISSQIFSQRNLKFENIQAVSFEEFNSWPTGSFLPPKEGTLVKTKKNPTLYWVAGQSLHPINKAYYFSRGLEIFPLLEVSEQDLKTFPKGQAYITK